MFGRKFTIIGPLEGPSGTVATLVTVWVIHGDKDVPRFVTAYPGSTR